jgi:hypothetical protein
MQNTIANLTQTEFDQIMKDAELKSAKEELVTFSEIILDYLSENKIGFNRAQIENLARKFVL